MGNLIQLTDPKNKVHTCDVCGDFGEWTENWSWQWKFIKVNGMPHEEEVKFCTEKCRNIYNNLTQSKEITR